MKNQFIKLFAIVCCVLFFVFASHAKKADGEIFEIPFNFIVKGKAFSAGKYSVQRLNPANPNLLTIKNLDGSIQTLLLTQGTTFAKPGNTSVLSFKHLGDEYFLESLWMTDEKLGYQFLSNETADKLQKAETIQLQKK